MSIETSIIDESVRTFNQYYPAFFASNSTKTLIIPSSNDFVDEYFYGKFDDDDHPSKYEPTELSKERKRIVDEVKKLTKESYRLLKQAESMTDQDDKKRLTNESEEHVEMANIIKAEMERSDQPWNKLLNIQKNREKITITKLINAFRNADIGGILIISPKQNEELNELIENECNNNYPEWKKFLVELKKYPEICDCIYFHNVLGIYTIEVKATKELKPMTIDERKWLTKEKTKNNPYEKAVFQLSRMLIPTNNETMSLLQKLYVLITGSSVIPRISGIVCTPEAKLSDIYENHLIIGGCANVQIISGVVSTKLSESRRRDYLDQRFHHFDLHLLSSIDEFHQFWSIEMSNQDSIESKSLFEQSTYQRFIATMANCSVGRELFGVKNALTIAQMIFEQKIDPTMMAKREYINKTTIFLNSKQMEILNDKITKLKFIYGPPGTGKTLLVILAAIDAAKEKQNNENVVVFTREWLIEYTKRIIELNGLKKNAIDVRDFTLGIGKINENDDIFVDEFLADAIDIKYMLNVLQALKHGKLFLAISGQADIADLCFVEEKLEKSLNDAMNYRIFRLTDILRGTRSIIEFWTKRLINTILTKELKMECGHSIVGQNVDHYQCVTSQEMMEKMVDVLNELMRNNELKNIAIICGDHDLEKDIIQKKLNVAFGASIHGSVIEQDSNRTCIAVGNAGNVFSREWPFVIFVSLFPTFINQLPIIASSRAVAHLTIIERNETKIRKIIRDNYDNETLKTIRSSFKEYNMIRNEIKLADEEYIINCDLWIDIISNNHLPQQIKQLFPRFFDDCNTLDEFLSKIVIAEQWMLLLFVHEWEYFEEIQHANASILLTFEYRKSKVWLQTFEIGASREQQLTDNVKSAIELINKYVQPQVRQKMQNLFGKSVFGDDASNGVHQFDLIGNSIRQIININAHRIQEQPEIQIYHSANEIDEQINKLLQNPRLLRKDGCSIF